jgi:general secretion pathway protein D
MTINTLFYRFFKKLITIVFILSISGCELIGPQLHQKLPLTAVNKVEDEGLLLPQLANQSSFDAENNKTKVEVFTSDQASSIDEKVLQKSKGHTGEKGEFSLNFNDADITEVAKVILGDILNRNYTISPQVTGKVALQTSKPLNRSELIPTLEMLLTVNNAALTEQNGMYLIKPANESLYSSSISSLSSSKMPIGYQIKVIPVKNVSAIELSDLLKPLLPEKSLLHVDSARNLMLVAGSNAEINRIIDLVNTFDIDVLKGRSFGLFTPAHVSAAKIIDELNQIFNNKKEKEGEVSFFRFIEIERLNAVLAITHQDHYLRSIENWILRLDRVNTEAAGGVNVYRAQHVNALDLSDTLNNIFKNGTQTSSKASIASGRKSLSASNKSDSSNDSAMGSNQNSDNKSLNKPTSGALGSGTASGANNNDLPNVKIIADSANNSLIIVATAQEYKVIQSVLKQIDVLPLQVMIDATIVEVTLNDQLKYGIQWYLTHNNGGTNIITGGSASPPEGINLTDIAKGVTTGGFSYAFSSGSKDINAVLQASATDNNINVISSPSLMVLNNQEASIKVGDSVPIRSSISTNLNNSTPGGIQTSSIQMIDTGIHLAVRPRVNAGGLVSMDILQTVNQAKATTDISGIDSPTITKREIETSVVVQNGETIALGGLIKESNDYSRFGVPVLHEIPLFGSLFGSTSRNKDKTELVVLLTPRVMKSRQDAQDVTEEFKRKLSGIYVEPVELNISN